MKITPSISSGLHRLFDPSFPFTPSGKGRIHYAWIIAFASAIGVLCSMPGQTIGVGVFTEVLIENLELRRTWVSFAYLLGTLGSGFLIGYAGRWLDQYGLRAGAVVAATGLGVALLYLSQIDRLVAVGGLLLPSVVMPLFALAMITFGFFLLRFFGQGILTLASRNLIPKWFDAMRGRVNSYCGVLASLGFAASPWFLDQLIQTVGWRWAWGLLALICGFCFGIFAWFFFRDNPEECGLEQDAGWVASAGGKVNQDNVVVHHFTRAEVLRNYSFWVLNLGFAYQGFFVTAYTFHILSIADTLSIERSVLLGAFLPAAGLSLMVSLAAGWLIDRTRLKYVFSFFCLGMIVFPSGLLLLSNPLGLPLLILGMGMAGGCFTPILGTAWARYFGRRHLGSISGFNMSSLIIGSSLGPIAFSLSFDWFASYIPCLILSVVLGALFLCSSFFASNPQRKLAAGDES